MSNAQDSLSVVIPAFNERQRLPPVLETLRTYLDGKAGRYEVIVVDDGSTDGTANFVQRAVASWPELRLLRHAKNQGKGAAVRTGVLAANGAMVLFIDADGATPIREVENLTQRIVEGADVAIGSRRSKSPCSVRTRSFVRAAIGGLFSRVAAFATGVSVRDTQCGFKLFRQEPARVLFSATRETGYLFDVELLALAARTGYTVVEQPVTWCEMPGSKIRLIRDGLAMTVGLVRVSVSVRLRAPAAAGATLRPANILDTQFPITSGSCP